MKILEKQSGVAFTLKQNQYLKITDIKGEQVSDMVFFSKDDIREKYSAAKTMDFEESILLSTRNYLWSNRGRKMMYISEDTNGRNDALLAPCSQQTFDIMYDTINGDHPSCFNNLCNTLQEYDIHKDDIPAAFNVFMNVQFNEAGKLSVLPPTSKAGDYVIFKALEDLIIGLTSCSAPDSNGGSFKEIGYQIKNKL